jgi:diguanylate cyclase (GGDEF)-like protein/PAS domain S-box-containing protein
MRFDGRQANVRHWATGLAGVCALLLVAQAVLCLWQARSLQLRLDHLYVAEATGGSLSDALARDAGARSLRPLLDGLLQREDLGLRFVAVRDAEGVVLTRAGVFESLSLSWLPQSWARQLRDLLYQIVGSGGSRRIVSPENRLLGSVDYSIAPGAVRGIRVDAVAALRLAGWMSAAVMLVLGTMAVIGWRRLRRQRPQWTGRADPLRRAESEGRGGDLEQLGGRGGVLMETLDYGLIVTDRETRVRYCNGIAERLTGWPSGDAGGRLLSSILHLVDEEDGVVHDNPIEAALRQGRKFAAVVRLRGRSGELRPVDLTANLLRSAYGQTDGWAIALRDASTKLREFDELRREARLSQAVVDHLDEGLLTTDPAGVVRSANARAERMFGYSRDQLVGFTVTKLMPVPFLNVPGVRITDYVAGRNGSKLPKVVGWRRDATTFPAELWVQPMRVDEADGLVVIVRDISERLRGENLATRLGRLLDSAVEEVYIFDAQTLRLLEVNRGARSNLDYPAEALARMTPLDISEDLTEEMFNGYIARLRSGDQDHLIYRCRHRRANGDSYPVEVRLNFSREEEPPVFMAIAVDISDRLAAEERLNQLAHYDALTGLPNRITLYDRLQQAMLAAQRDPRVLGVFFLDLDRFKAINDEHGHEIGDQVLKTAAERMQSTVRPTDTVARLAGDEFVIIAPGLRSADDARFLAQKLLARFDQPMDLPGLSLTSRASIGITLYPLDDSDIEGLLRHADSAMYDAKQAGRGCYRMFSSEIDPERRRRLELEREIHVAVALNQFDLLMSPALDADGRVLAVLSGLHWNHPRYGNVSHDEVLRAAGRAGLVADLELWQICQVCEVLTAPNLRTSSLPCVVAVSGWQLRDPEFSRHVLDLLQRYAISGERLILALSPDGLADAQMAPADPQALLEHGIRFALRDFNAIPDVDGQLPLAFALIDASDPAVLASLPDRVVAAATVRWISYGIATTQAKEQSFAAGIDACAGPAVVGARDAAAFEAWLETRNLD